MRNVGIGKSTQGIRERLKAEAEANAAKRAQWTAKREEAVADKERDSQREQRLQQFIAKAAAQAPTLDDLTPDQRRVILLDMHAEAYIGRPDDPNHRRIFVLFSLTAEAAAHAFTPGGQPDYQTTWYDAHGNSYSVFATEGWPPTERLYDANGEEYVDFSTMPDADPQLDTTSTPHRGKSPKTSIQ